MKYDINHKDEHKGHEKNHGCGCNHAHKGHEKNHGCGCCHSQEVVNASELYKMMPIFGVLIFAAAFIIEKTNIVEVNVSPYYFMVIYGCAWICLGWELVVFAISDLKKGHVLGEEFLMCIASLGAFAIQECPEAVAVILLYRVGEFFEHKAANKSRAAVMEAVNMRPDTVLRVDDTVDIFSSEFGKNISEIEAKTARVGDILLVRPGDIIPLDGKVVRGESHIDTAPITGEPLPVYVKRDLSVTSGCVNLDGVIYVEVQKPLGESMVTKILHAVEDATRNKPRMDRFISRFARVYTPIVCVLALLIGILPSLIVGDWKSHIYIALNFLVISCPCALVISVPLAFFTGIGVASRAGILLNGGYVLEALGKIKAVVMDKTGTLTLGKFCVEKVTLSKLSSSDKSILEDKGIAVDKEFVLAYAASCEQYSNHPIAKGIVNRASELNIELLPAENVVDKAGEGVKGCIDGKNVFVGKYSKENIAANIVDTNDDTLADLEKDNETSATKVVVIIEGIVVGFVLLADIEKKDARSAIEKLKARKLYTVMLTGDDKEVAKKVSQGLGIDRSYARLLPTEKLDKMREIRKEKGATLFVGDGINDAPVLAGSDVGAAMGSGADAAISAADMVYMSTEVSKIPESISIAKKTMRIAKENIVAALAIKIAIMIISAMGFANMWLAVLADTGVALLLVFNSVRMFLKKK